ncbi:hypothetical protein LTR66_017212, partial [Elasticomyces elasticus]
MPYWKPKYPWEVRRVVEQDDEDEISPLHRVLGLSDGAPTMNAESIEFVEPEPHHAK